MSDMWTPTRFPGEPEEDYRARVRQSINDQLKAQEYRSWLIIAAVLLLCGFAIFIALTEKS